MNKKTAVVVGAGFIGSHICKILDTTYNIVALDVNKDSLEKLSSSYDTVQIDCLDEDLTEKAFSQIFDTHDYPYVLVNSIGLDAKINSDTGFDEFSNQKVEEFEKTIIANLSSIFLTSQNFYLNLKELNKNGIILNISSDLGHIAPNHKLYNEEDTILPNQKPAHYSVSKFGLEGLTKYLAATIAPLVRVNSLCPSGILNSDMDEKFQNKLRNLNPMNGIMELSDLDGAIKFLATDESRFVNGHSLIIDGGRSIL